MVNKQKDLPVIAYSQMPTYLLDVCKGCGSDVDLRNITFRVGYNAATNIVWCRTCRETVSRFLGKKEEDQVEDVQSMTI